MATATSSLDLAFAMDCTGSMASYIKSATDNIRLIVDEIVSKENIGIRFGLIEYRDHPPQDSTFITRVHSFTNSVSEAKGWLEGCSAQGGGDGPEAVADALNDALNLPWNRTAVKICILISDAPPHGLVRAGDSFPDGCPLGHDPLAIARKMAEKCITLYTVGVEPPIVPYRDFFMTLAHVTGGQYVPMTDAARLAQMIISGVREEISIDRLMHSSRSDIVREIRKAAATGVDDKETAERLHKLFSKKKLSVNRMNNTAGIPSKEAEECYSKCVDMADIQRQYKQSQAASETKPFNMNYQLEENKTVTIEQSKRIVQKAKNWDYSAEELNEERKRTMCKWGSRCYDKTSYHRAKYEHPSNDDHPTRRSHDTRSDEHNTRNSQLSSHRRDHDENEKCRYGAKCYDHSESHREKYSHPQNDERPTGRHHDTTRDDHHTRRSHDTRSDEHNTRNSQLSSHRRDHDENEKCRYGTKCYDQSDYHRKKYSHPTTRH